MPGHPRVATRLRKPATSGKATKLSGATTVIALLSRVRVVRLQVRPASHRDVGKCGNARRAHLRALFHRAFTLQPPLPGRLVDNFRSFLFPSPLFPHFPPMIVEWSALPTTPIFHYSATVARLLINSQLSRFPGAPINQPGSIIRGETSPWKTPVSASFLLRERGCGLRNPGRDARCARMCASRVFPRACLLRACPRRVREN